MYLKIVLAALTINFVNGSAEAKDSTESNVEEVSKVEGEGRSFHNRYNRPYYGNVVYDRPYSYGTGYQNPYGFPQQQYNQQPQQYDQRPQQYGQRAQQNYVNVDLNTGTGGSYDPNYGYDPEYTNNAGGAVNNINVDVDLQNRPGLSGQNYPVIPGRIPPIRPYHSGYPRLYRSRFVPVKRSIRQSRSGLNKIITDNRSGNEASYIENNFDSSPDANYKTKTNQRDSINQVITDAFRTAPPLAKRAQRVEENNINPGFNNEQMPNRNTGYNNPQMTNPNPSGFNNAQMPDRNTGYNNPRMTKPNLSGLHNARQPARNQGFNSAQMSNQNHGFNSAQMPNQKYEFNSAQMPILNHGFNNARMPDRNPGFNNARMAVRNPGFNNARMPDRNFAHNTANNRILKSKEFDETDFGLTENSVNDKINKEMSSQVEDLAVEDGSDDY